MEQVFDKEIPTDNKYYTQETDVTETSPQQLDTSARRPAGESSATHENDTVEPASLVSSFAIMQSGTTTKTNRHPSSVVLDDFDNRRSKRARVDSPVDSEESIAQALTTTQDLYRSLQDIQARCQEQESQITTLKVENQNLATSHEQPGHQIKTLESLLMQKVNKLEEENSGLKSRENPLASSVESLTKAAQEQKSRSNRLEELLKIYGVDETGLQKYLRLTGKEGVSSKDAFWRLQTERD